jgi:hypothetical protein
MRKEQIKFYTILWALVLAVQILTVILIQFPLCHFKVISEFFQEQDPIFAIQILSMLFILPAFIFLMWRLKTAKQRYLQGFIYFIVCLPLLLVLWPLGFYTSRLLFTNC